MAAIVRHSKISLVTDSSDSTLVRPSDWNAQHVITGVVETGDVRRQLTEDETYYVNPSGSDGNTGLGPLASDAWATIQHAWDIITGTLDQGTFTVTLQFEAGTYTDNRLSGSDAAPTGPFVLSGDPDTPTNVVLEFTSASVFRAGLRFSNCPHPVVVDGFQVILTAQGGYIGIDNCPNVTAQNMNFVGTATIADGHVPFIVFRSFLGVFGTLDFTDKFASACVSNGYSIVEMFPATVTFNGSVSFSQAFALNSDWSQFSWYQYGQVGSATGKQYVISEYAQLFAYGQDVPGDVTGTFDATSYGDLFDGISSWTIAADGGLTLPSVLNFPVISAPGSPVDGDIWREDNTNTGLKIRVNGVTKTITLS